jgi:hypothetical protein
MSSKVFISYSRKDELFARALAVDLEACGAEIWIDIDDIPVGARWSAAIQEGLRQSQVMILITSPDAMASANVEDEWNYFFDKKKPIVLVYWRTCEPQFQLWRMPRIDFRAQKAQYPAAFKTLIGTLRQQGLALNLPRDLPSGQNAFMQQTLAKAIQQAQDSAPTDGPPTAPQPKPKKAAQSLPMSRAQRRAWLLLLASVLFACASVLGAVSLRRTWQTEGGVATADPSPSPDSSPSPEPSPLAQATRPSPESPPEFELVYDAQSIYLRNLSSQTQDLSSLRFVQSPGGGSEASGGAMLADRVFTSLTWQQGGGDSVARMLPGACYQISRDSELAGQRPAACRVLSGWLWSGDPKRYFWEAAFGPDFVVYWEGQAVQTCPIAAGACQFSLVGFRG